MDTINSLDDLEICLKENKNINFLAIATTPLHAVGVNAAIEYLKSISENLSGIILLKHHKETGKHIYNKDFDIQDEDLCIYDCTMRYNYYSNFIEATKMSLQKVEPINNKDNIVYVVTCFPDQLFSYIVKQFGKKAVFVCIDDGSSSYINRLKDRLQYVKMYGGKNRLKIYLKYIINIVYECVYENWKKRLIKKHRIIDFRIFDNTSGCFIPNRLSVDNYVRAFNKSYKGEYSEINSFEKSIIFNTQTLEENHITDGIIDLMLYKEVVEMAQKHGIRCVVKPHPREINIEKYEQIGCEVFKDKTISQEALLANLNHQPYCIISLCSSTLLNAYGLYSIPVISLAKIMMNRSNNTFLNKLLDDYINEYKSIVAFPDSIEELDSMIQEIFISRQSD